MDGDSEFAALTLLMERLKPSTGATYLRIVKADIQPLAPIPVMARGCQNAITQLQARGAEAVIVLVDREETGPVLSTFRAIFRRRSRFNLAAT